MGASSTTKTPKAQKARTIERHYYESVGGLEGALHLQLMRYNPSKHERQNMYRWGEHYTNTHQAGQAARRVVRLMENAYYTPGRRVGDSLEEVWEIACEAGVQIELGMTDGGRWYLKVVQTEQEAAHA